MARHLKLIISAVIVCAVAFLILKFFGYHSKDDKGWLGCVGRLLNATNSFDVKYINIDPEKIDVLWRSEDGADTLVRNGKTISNFGYAYGPERFDVFYDGALLCSHGMWSTNNNDPYSVELSISAQDNAFVVEYRINEEITSVRIDSNRIVKNCLL